MGTGALGTLDLPRWPQSQKLSWPNPLSRRRDRRPEMDVEYVFCDTHKELPETYEYLTRIEAYLGKPVTRLSSGLGERGFDHWLKVYGSYLPAPNMRWCTKKLKIEPFEAYVGDDPVFLYVGIR